MYNYCMRNLKVLGISGSSREGSVNSKLLDIAGKALVEKGADFEAFDLRANPIPMYDLEFEMAQGFPASVKALRDKISEADALLISSPEYNAGYTPLLKALSTGVVEKILTPRSITFGKARSLP